VAAAQSLHACVLTFQEELTSGKLPQICHHAKIEISIPASFSLDQLRLLEPRTSDPLGFADKVSSAGVEPTQVKPAAMREIGIEIAALHEISRGVRRTGVRLRDHDLRRSKRTLSRLLGKHETYTLESRSSSGRRKRRGCALKVICRVRDEILHRLQLFVEATASK